MAHLKNNLKALILVGGYGTRLRPLTYTVPKPLVPFINKPILEHQIEALVAIGVKEIILALNYYSELIIKKVKTYKEKYNINIIYSKEESVLGTAGPIALAKKYLIGEFFVLNSDVICEYPLHEMMKFYLKSKNEVTMLTTNVKDPSRYGLVITHEKTNIVKAFIEKPTNALLNRINAGIYIFNESILKRIELKESSLERDIFPNIVKDNMLGIFELKGFWMDIGQIKDYLLGQHMFLKRFLCKEHDIEKNVVKGKNVKIGENVIIENSTIFDNVIIGNNVLIRDSIIGWNSVVKDGAKIINGSVLGNYSSVAHGCVLDCILMSPDKIVEF